MAKKVQEIDKMNSGKRVERPEILADKYTKMDLVKQSNLLSGSKGKGTKKTDISALPAGVQESLKRKEAIQQVTKQGDTNFLDKTAQEKMEYDLSPMNRKKANELKEQRIEKFSKARNTKGKSITLDALNEQLKIGDRQQLEHIAKLDTTPAKSRTQIKKEAEKKAAKK